MRIRVRVRVRVKVRVHYWDRMSYVEDAENGSDDAQDGVGLGRQVWHLTQRNNSQIIIIEFV